MGLMPAAENYWFKQTVKRRRMLQGAAALGGVTALSLVGCGSSKDNKQTSAPPSQDNLNPTRGTPGVSQANLNQATATPGVSQTGLDPTKGTPGGLLRIQPSGYPAGLTLVNSAQDANRFAGLTHSGLLE